MKFSTIDFRKEVNHELLEKMEKEILKYENLTIEQVKERKEIKGMLEDFVKMQGEYGFFPLVVDDHIPNDCMYYYNRKTSYIILKLFMMNHDPSHKEVIIKALNGIKLSKLVGHGYDFKSEQCNNLAMLLEANILDYADDELKEMIGSIIEEIINDLVTGNTSFGFGDWSKEAKHLYDVVMSMNIEL